MYNDLPHGFVLKKNSIFFRFINNTRSLVLFCVIAHTYNVMGP